VTGEVYRRILKFKRRLVRTNKHGVPRRGEDDETCGADTLARARTRLPARRREQPRETREVRTERPWELMSVGEREDTMATDWGPGRSQRTRPGRRQEQRHEELGGALGSYGDEY
jgi:hypothetical protein